MQFILVGYWAARAGFYSNPRNNRVPRSAEPEPLYLGLGGVVGSLTPRTGPSYSGGGSRRRSSFSGNRFGGR